MALFSILISPLNAFPWVLNGLVEAWVSTKRVQEFLRLEELDFNQYYLFDSPDCSDAGSEGSPTLVRKHFKAVDVQEPFTDSVVSSKGDLHLSVTNGCFTWSRVEEEQASDPCAQTDQTGQSTSTCVDKEHRTATSDGGFAQVDSSLDPYGTESVATGSTGSTPLLLPSHEGGTLLHSFTRSGKKTPIQQPPETHPSMEEAGVKGSAMEASAKVSLAILRRSLGGILQELHLFIHHSYISLFGSTHFP